MSMTRIGAFHFSRCEVITLLVVGMMMASFFMNMAVLYFTYYPSYSSQRNTADAAMKHCERDPRHPACTSAETIDMAQSSPTTNSIWMASSMASTCWGKGCGHYVNIITGSIFNMLIAAFVGFVVLSLLGISIFEKREEMERYPDRYTRLPDMDTGYAHRSMRRVNEIDDNDDEDTGGSMCIQMDGNTGVTRRR